MQAMLNDWCSEEGLSWEFTPQNPPLRKHFTTAVDDSNVWWTLFKSSCEVKRWFDWCQS